MPAVAYALPDAQPWESQRRRPRAKRPVLFPPLPAELAPQMVQATGARVWSAAGAEYVDFDNNGGAVLLGHRDPDVVAAVRHARADQSWGVVDRLRAELEERILGFTPGAEAVVFGGDVSQALRAATTCAREATGRPQVLACRTNAWRGGVHPPALPVHDLPALERLIEMHGEQIAALVLSPWADGPPTAAYLSGVRALLDQAGALLILDESQSGFRAHQGGAQALFGVRAELVVYGENLSNGMAFGALAGEAQLIERADPGELAAGVEGLAAARAVLVKMAREPVLPSLRLAGVAIQVELARRLDGAGLTDILHIVGDPAAFSIGFCPPAGVDAAALKALWVGEWLTRNLYSRGAVNLSYAHGEAEAATLLLATEHAADRLTLALRRGQLAGRRLEPTQRPRAP